VRRIGFTLRDLRALKTTSKTAASWTFTVPAHGTVLLRIHPTNS